jgi:nuclease-like protein
MHAEQPQPQSHQPERHIEVGRPGASAREEFARRQESDDRHRRETFGRFVAPVVKLVTGERQSTSAWEQGGRGEERVGNYLTRAVGLNGVVLHDRAVPGSRANIDHIAIVPTGVWVIDTKQYSGRVQQRDLGGWFVSRPALFVNGRDRSALIPAVLRQLALVETFVPAEVPIHAALCFADADWGVIGRPFVIDQVTITWAKRLAGSLVEPGPVEVDTIRSVASRIAGAFGIYAPSGTSHSPTGA